MSTEMSDLTKALASVISPLSPEEERVAIEAARAHLGADLSDRSRVMGGELRISKPANPETIPTRLISVLIVDYGNRRNLDVLVDPTGRVERVIDLKGAQPAYTDEEIAEARAVAESDDRIASMAQVADSFVSVFGPDRAQDNARRVGLRYATMNANGDTKSQARLVVDLSAASWVQIDEGPQAS